jgi:hypothetical protein
LKYEQGIILLEQGFPLKQQGSCGGSPIVAVSDNLGASIRTIVAALGLVPRHRAMVLLD